ncbi:MAG: glycosyltransferase family 2 protein [Christensenellales bacterium]|jgi:glycosyltransferase involved in cell wall biosynthesis
MDLRDLRVCVIVPVYQSAAYLPACLDAILAQTHRALQVLLIDDGSTDGSADLCDRYARADPRVEVIHKVNEGQSVARNLGIERCQCPYLFFVDSDDTLPVDAVAQLLRPLEQGAYDVVAGRLQCVRDGVPEPLPAGVAPGPLRHDPSDRARWNRFKVSSDFGYVPKLYRTAFLRQHGIRFDDIRRVLMEDTLFNLRVWLEQPAFFVTDAVVYTYAIRSQTSSNRAMNTIAQRAVRALELYGQAIDAHGTLARDLDLAVPLAMRMFCWCLVNNLLYAKPDGKQMRAQIAAFTHSEPVMAMLRQPGAARALATIPSLAQRLFYGYCLRLLRAGRAELLYGTFRLLYPAMLAYAKSVLNK